VIEIELAFPPSVNHYWGTKVMRRANRSTISRYVNKPGKVFRTDTIYRCAVAKLPRAIVGKLRCEIDLYPPDKRIRDCDNYPKSILDALVHAGIMRDDSQIVDLRVRMMNPVKPGRVSVRLETAGG
jgi:crossover junction endodeoxyribonuclease RusA